ncbi:MAG: Ig-like domain-containing protein [Planctomycetota bacterium]
MKSRRGTKRPLFASSNLSRLARFLGDSLRAMGPRPHVESQQPCSRSLSLEALESRLALDAGITVYFENFNAADISTVGGEWSFAKTPSFDSTFWPGATPSEFALTNADGPLTGNHLVISPDGDYSSWFAVLELDLSAYYANRQNLKLDFLVKSFTDINEQFILLRYGELDFPGQPTYINWEYQENVFLPDEDNYYHVTIENLSPFFWQNDTFRLAWYFSGSTGDSMNRLASLENVRITYGGNPPTAEVTSLTSTEPGTVQVTFSTEMDAASFTTGDIEVLDPLGNPMTLTGDPVDSGDHKTFTFTIASPITVDGTFTVNLDADIFDSEGIPFDYNGNGIYGEPTDSYSGTVRVQAPPEENPFYQGFENGDWIAQGWTFFQSGTSTVAVTDQNDPTFGDHHVEFISNSSDYSAADVLLDLSSFVGETNLWLDFQVRDDDYPASINQMILVARNADDPGWSPPIAIDPVGNDYTRFVIDFDEMLTSAGISLTEPIHLEFVRFGTGSTTRMHLDDVRIHRGTNNLAPTMTMSSGIHDATLGLPYTITYSALLNSANDNSPDGDPISVLIDAVYTGTVTKNGVPVIPGTTTLSAGETLVYTPTDIVSGANVLGIRAFDGELVSQNVVPVWFNFATNIAPTLSTINTLSLAQQDHPFTVTYAALAAAANEADANGNSLSFRVEAISSGTLTKNGVAIAPGVTLLSTGEELVWTPLPGTNGQGVNMFTVRAWDGLLACSSAVQVKVNFNSPPTLTNMSTLTGANEDQPRTITYANLTSAGNEADPDGNAISFRIESGDLGDADQELGVAVVPVSRLCRPGNRSYGRLPSTPLVVAWRRSRSRPGTDTWPPVRPCK